MRIYISGPITGVRKAEENFKRTEKQLTEAGMEVINPYNVNSMVPFKLTHEQYMEIDLALMSVCDSVYMLNGWRDSKGACVEFEYAFENKMLIMFEGGKVNV